MKNPKTSENGQILVFLAFTVFILVGFAAAAALDGGMIYSDRRHSQNSSDASSLAGGSAAGLILDQLEYDSFTCGHSVVTTARNAAQAAAIARGTSNNFTLSATSSSDPGENEVAVECTVNNSGSFPEKFLDIKTKISSTVTTAFMQLAFKGEVKNTVDSVVRIYPRTPLAFGEAVVALSDTCHGGTGGVEIDGSSEISISGGGIFSNACLDTNGSSLELCVNADPGEDDCEGDGTIRYYTNYSQSGNPDIEPSPSQAPDRMPVPEVTVPDCSGLPNHGDYSGGGTIDPGRYDRIRLNSGSLTLNPGLYCLNGEFRITGGDVFGDDVTIFMNAGDFTTPGNGEIQLSAPDHTCTVCPPAMAGMLIYMPEWNTGDVNLAGNSTSYYVGSVYVPRGTIDVGGGSSALETLHTQLVGETVKIHGNVTIDINYLGGDNYKEPATLDLYR